MPPESHSRRTRRATAMVETLETLPTEYEMNQSESTRIDIFGRRVPKGDTKLLYKFASRPTDPEPQPVVETRSAIRGTSITRQTIEFTERAESRAGPWNIFSDVNGSETIYNVTWRAEKKLKGKLFMFQNVPSTLLQVYKLIQTMQTDRVYNRVFQTLLYIIYIYIYIYIYIIYIYIIF